MQKITPFLWPSNHKNGVIFCKLGELYAKNYSIFVVRRPRRRGDEFLRFNFQEFESSGGYSIWRSRARTEGNSHVRDIPTRRTKLLRTQRWPTIQLHASYIVLRELSVAARSRRTVGKAF